MKNIKAKIVVFFSTILVGFLIATNYNFQGSSSSLKLNVKEYQNAIETKNNLIKQVASLRQINSDTKTKVDKYNNSDIDNVKILEDMKMQVADYGRLTGLNEVRGPGLVITINDGSINKDEDTQSIARQKYLHDADMARVLNEIRYAGAEAIAINKHRVSPLTGVNCDYAFLMFNDDTTGYAPFNVYAIGNPETLKASLVQQGSFLNQLLSRGLSVEVEIKAEITMPAANIGPMEYAKEYINKK
ncbi:MAG TPA: DUF881 domain-containing protein [Clostridium sp.]